MAHREPNPFADEDHGAFPAEGGHRLQRGWYGDDGTFVPSPSSKTSHSRRDHRGNDARDAGGSSTSADDRREAQRLRQRVAHLETTNARLEREIRSLRALASASANETTAVRVDALRHLTAAEDHVQLLHDESQSKLAALHAEMASVGGDAARDAAGGEREERRRRAPAPAPTTPRGAFATRCVASRRRRRRWTRRRRSARRSWPRRGIRLGSFRRRSGRRAGEDREQEEGRGFVDTRVGWIVVGVLFPS